MTKRIKLPVYIAVATLGLALAFVLTGTHQASGQVACTPPYCPAGGGGGGNGGGGGGTGTTTVTTPSQTVTAPNQNASPGLAHNPHVNNGSTFTVAPDLQHAEGKVDCDATQPANCKGTLFLLHDSAATPRAKAHAAAMVEVAQGAYDIKPGETATVVLKLTPAGIRLVAANKSLPTIVANRTTDSAGQVTQTVLGTVTLKSSGRKTPKVSAKTTPSSDGTLPYKFTTKGKLTLPSGVGRSVGCKAGKVAVTFKAGKRTVSTRRATITKTCTYKSSVKFTLKNRLKPGVLKVKARFTGNAVLAAATSKTRKVNVG